MGKLSAKKVEFLRQSGYYGDGDNLYMQVSSSNSKSWIFRFSLDGKRREMGIGPYPEITLEKAREAVIELRRLVKSGIDPIEQRKAEQAAKRAERNSAVTFAFCAEQYIESHRHGWKNVKHAQQWANTLEQYAYPVIGETIIKDVDTALIMRVLQPIWLAKNETAGRLRGRMENILDWAAVQGFRAIENPARWKGHLDNLLASPGKVQKNSHFKALPYSEINPLILALRANGSVSAKALEFLILTAARTGEIIGACWDEIDFDNQLWIVPADRMKAGREHRIPLSSRAFDIIKEMHALKTNDAIFPGRSKGGFLSNAAMDKLLQQTLGFDATVHGMRSTFRDWASERTAYPHEVCEMALAHTIRNQAEAAYRRGDLIEKRRLLMEDWLKFCETASDAAGADIIPIRKVSL
ncbi:integrase arm-type DNA-binding domain-containing protein [Methylobacter sp. BlB1]|uniref:tyrosine-type recombinase/integrase n=1 Tax=Methylobacter sp. BlB1 TaxID=2785914 RepID=UPI0018933DD3|nr:integrase arm-type DNA-binding domain-containing protein [Methylobacter sp. BlB1]MBF6649532.1 integrase arm-type DNA-binding domain-containing protein [Methylobacter sp. BlB1]